MERVEPHQLRKGYRSCAETSSQMTSKFMLFFWGKSFLTLSRQLQGMLCNRVGVWKVSSAQAGQWFVFFLSPPSKSSPYVFVSMQFVGWPTLICSPLTFCEIDSLYLPVPNLFQQSTKDHRWTTINGKLSRTINKNCQEESINSKLPTTNYQQSWNIDIIDQPQLVTT